MTLSVPPMAAPYSAGITPLTIWTSAIDSALMMSILLNAPYEEIFGEPDAPLASLPFASTAMALPPSPFKRKRLPAMPSPVSRPLMRPEATVRMLVMLRLIMGSELISAVSILMRCSVESVLTNGASPVTSTVWSTPPISRM